LKKILFRVDADKSIGLGHYMRCIAISSYLDSKIDCFFITKSDEVVTLNKGLSTFKISSKLDLEQEIKFVSEIVDKYKIDVIISDINNPTTMKDKVTYLLYLSKLNNLKSLLVTFEDFKTNQVDSDLVIIPYVGASKINITDSNNSSFLLGPKYFVLRKEFKVLNTKKDRRAIPTVLISMGGSDVKNLTEEIVKITSTIPDIHINIVKGSISKFQSNEIRNILKTSLNSFDIYESPKNIAQIMNESDLGIFSSGLTQYESSVLGLPAVVISLNGYHKQIVDEFAGLKSVISFGKFTSDKSENLRKTIINLLNNKSKRNEMSDNGRKIIDGKGVERIINEIKNRLERAQ